MDTTNVQASGVIFGGEGKPNKKESVVRRDVNVMRGEKLSRIRKIYTRDEVIGSGQFKPRTGIGIGNTISLPLLQVGDVMLTGARLAVKAGRIDPGKGLELVSADDGRGALWWREILGVASADEMVDNTPVADGTVDQSYALMMAKAHAWAWVAEPTQRMITVSQAIGVPQPRPNCKTVRGYWYCDIEWGASCIVGRRAFTSRGQALSSMMERVFWELLSVAGVNVTVPTAAVSLAGTDKAQPNLDYRVGDVFVRADPCDTLFKFYRTGLGRRSRAYLANALNAPVVGMDIPRDMGGGRLMWTVCDWADETGFTPGLGSNALYVGWAMPKVEGSKGKVRITITLMENTVTSVGAYSLLGGAHLFQSPELDLDQCPELGPHTVFPDAYDYELVSNLDTLRKNTITHGVWVGKPQRVLHQVDSFGTYPGTAVYNQWDCDWAGDIYPTENVPMWLGFSLWSEAWGIDGTLKLPDIVMSAVFEMEAGLGRVADDTDVAAAGPGGLPQQAKRAVPARDLVVGVEKNPGPIVYDAVTQSIRDEDWLDTGGPLDDGTVFTVDISGHKKHPAGNWMEAANWGGALVRRDVNSSRKWFFGWTDTVRRLVGDPYSDLPVLDVQPAWQKHPDSKHDEIDTMEDGMGMPEMRSTAVKPAGVSSTTGRETRSNSPGTGGRSVNTVAAGGVRLNWKERVELVARKLSTLGSYVRWCLRQLCTGTGSVGKFCKDVLLRTTFASEPGVSALACALDNVESTFWDILSALDAVEALFDKTKIPHPDQNSAGPDGALCCGLFAYDAVRSCKKVELIDPDMLLLKWTETKNALKMRRVGVYFPKITSKVRVEPAREQQMVLPVEQSSEKLSECEPEKATQSEWTENDGAFAFLAGIGAADEKEKKFEDPMFAPIKNRALCSFGERLPEQLSAPIDRAKSQLRGNGVCNALNRIDATSITLKFSCDCNLAKACSCGMPMQTAYGLPPKGVIPAGDMSRKEYIEWAAGGCDDRAETHFKNRVKDCHCLICIEKHPGPCDGFLGMGVNAYMHMQNGNSATATSAGKTGSMPRVFESDWDIMENMTPIESFVNSTIGGGTGDGPADFIFHNSSSSMYSSQMMDSSVPEVTIGAVTNAVTTTQTLNPNELLMFPVEYINQAGASVPITVHQGTLPVWMVQEVAPPQGTGFAVTYNTSAVEEWRATKDRGNTKFLNQVLASGYLLRDLATFASSFSTSSAIPFSLEQIALKMWLWLWKKWYQERWGRIAPVGHAGCNDSFGDLGRYISCGTLVAPFTRTTGRDGFAALQNNPTVDVNGTWPFGNNVGDPVNAKFGLLRFHVTASTVPSNDSPDSIVYIPAQLLQCGLEFDRAVAVYLGLLSKWPFSLDRWSTTDVNNVRVDAVAGFDRVLVSGMTVMNVVVPCFYHNFLSPGGGFAPAAIRTAAMYKPKWGAATWANGADADIDFQGALRGVVNPDPVVFLLPWLLSWADRITAQDVLAVSNSVLAMVGGADTGAIVKAMWMKACGLALNFRAPYRYAGKGAFVSLIDPVTVPYSNTVLSTTVTHASGRTPHNKMRPRPNGQRFYYGSGAPDCYVFSSNVEILNAMAIGAIIRKDATLDKPFQIDPYVISSPWMGLAHRLCVRWQACAWAVAYAYIGMTAAQMSNVGTLAYPSQYRRIAAMLMQSSAPALGRPGTGEGMMRRIASNLLGAQVAGSISGIFCIMTAPSNLLAGSVGTYICAVSPPSLAPAQIAVFDDATIDLVGDGIKWVTCVNLPRCFLPPGTQFRGRGAGYSYKHAPNGLRQGSEFMQIKGTGNIANFNTARENYYETVADNTSFAVWSDSELWILALMKRDIVAFTDMRCTNQAGVANQLQDYRLIHPPNGWDLTEITGNATESWGVIGCVHTRISFQGVVQGGDRYKLGVLQAPPNTAFAGKLLGASAWYPPSAFVGPSGYGAGSFTYGEQNSQNTAIDFIASISKDDNATQTGAAPTVVPTVDGAVTGV